MSVFQLKISFNLTPEVNIAPLPDHTAIPTTICQVAGWGYPSEVNHYMPYIYRLHRLFFFFLFIFCLNFHHLVPLPEWSCDERGSYVRGFTTDEPWLVQETFGEHNRLPARDDLRRIHGGSKRLLPSNFCENFSLKI